MAYCINPECLSPRQSEISEPSEACQACGTSFLLKNRYWVERPLQMRHPLSSTAIFEVSDQAENYQKKVLKVLCEPSRTRIARLEQEYNVLSLLNAKGKIPRPDLDGFFLVPTASHPVYCLVEEKIEGITLEQWVNSSNRLSETLALDWLRQLVELVAIVHERYFHRDIKPSNLILRPDGQLALIDFGAVREVTETYLVKLRMGERQTEFNPVSSYSVTVVGSAGYSPVEQLHGQAVPQSDFFAIARTLVHLLTSKHPAQLPIEDSGKLIWRKYAPQVSPVFADFIDELQSPNWMKRTSNTEMILHRLDKLPRSIQQHRFRNSPQAKLFAILLGSLFLGALVWGMQKWQEQQRLAQAQHYTEMAVNAQMNGDTENARRAYKAALALNPKLISVRQNLALLCQSEGDIPCALQYYQEALALEPDNRQAHYKIHYNLASLYDQVSDYSKAETYYQKALGADSTVGIDAANNLSRIRNLKGDYPKAEKIAKQVLDQATDPVSRAALLKNLGWATFEQSRYQEAFSYLQQAQKLDPQRADVQCLLAQTQAARGEPAEQFWRNCFLYDSPSNVPEVKVWRENQLNKLMPQ